MTRNALIRSVHQYVSPWTWIAWLYRPSLITQSSSILLAVLLLAPIHSPAQALPCPSPLRINDPDCLSSDDRIQRLPHMTLTGKNSFLKKNITIGNRIQTNCNKDAVDRDLDLTQLIYFYLGKHEFFSAFHCWENKAFRCVLLVSSQWNFLYTGRK